MTEDTRVQKILKLLAKAEANGASAAEREAYSAKAAELMMAYGIEQAQLAAHSTAPIEKIVKVTIVTDVPKTYAHEYAVLGIRIARAFQCQGILTEQGGRKSTIIIGFESDVAQVEQMFRSLTIQCTLDLATWYSRNVRTHMNGTDKFNMKRSFIVGFANGVAEKFEQLKKTVVAQSAAGTDLVLVDRTKKVAHWIDENMRTRSTPSRSYTVNGTAAGHAAGQRANLGQTDLGGRGRAAVGR